MISTFLWYVIPTCSPYDGESEKFLFVEMHALVSPGLSSCTKSYGGDAMIDSKQRKEEDPSGETHKSRVSDDWADPSPLP